MWFYPLLVLLVILGVLGGTVLGGVYTIVLVPLAVIGLISALVYSLWGRSLQGSAGGSTDASATSPRPLPTGQQQGDGNAPSRPEALVDARREQQ
jgi:hypothetical protein